MQELDNLSGKQLQAIPALLATASVAAAAEQVDVDPSTLYRWMQDPAFAAALTRARRDTLAQATARLSALAVAAVEVLAAVMLNPKIGAQTRVTAAGKLLDLAYRAAEQDLVLDRIEALERQYEEERYAYGR
jgi:transposase-like protein